MCCCSTSSVILIVLSIDIGGNLNNTRIVDQIILFNGINLYTGKLIKSMLQ